MSAPVDRRRGPDAMNFRANPSLTPQRKVSLEHIHGMAPYPNVPPPGYGHNPMRMSDMMDYPGMMGPDPYDMSFMPMHPSEAAMGPNNFMMDQMMDFPPSRFMSPMRRPSNRPSPRGGMLPSGRRGSIGDYGMMDMHQPIQSPHAMNPRMMHPNMRPPLSNGEMTDTGASFSSASPAGSCPDIISTSQTGNTKRKERAPSSTSFPTKLYKILADPQYSEYIAWLPHGRAWRVLKPKALEEDVIPKFFRSDRYASFMRQVNGWGFKRITEGPDLNAYYHELFLRGLPQVCVKMRRPQKGDIGRASDIGQHPDFYKISMFAPLPEENFNAGPPPASPMASKGSPQDPAPKQESPEQSPSNTPPEIRAVPLVDVKVKCDSDAASGAPSETENSQDEKSIRADDAASTADVSDEVAQFNDSSANVASPRAFLERTMSEGFGIRTPVDYTEGPDSFGGMHRAPSGTSLSSWNDHDDPDLMWNGGMSTTSSIASPSMSHADTYMGSFASQCFSQVTPPGRLRMMPNSRVGPGYPQHPRQLDMMRAPYGMNGMNTFDDNADSSGLSVADLCYLTQQNRILLSQAHRRSD